MAVSVGLKYDDCVEPRIKWPGLECWSNSLGFFSHTASLLIPGGHYSATENVAGGEGRREEGGEGELRLILLAVGGGRRQCLLASHGKEIGSAPSVGLSLSEFRLPLAGPKRGHLSILAHKIPRILL